MRRKTSFKETLFLPHIIREADRTSFTKLVSFKAAWDSVVQLCFLRMEQMSSQTFTG